MYKPLQDVLKDFKLPEETTAKSEWNDWVGKFTDRLNEERGDYKPLTYKRVAMLLAPYKNDIHYFWTKCSEAKHFSKCFWWHVKK